MHALYMIGGAPPYLPLTAGMPQVMLTGEPSLVSMSAALLEAMLEHNSASLATLYQTGVFFFALAYCGSNLVEIGQLFKVFDILCAPP